MDKEVIVKIVIMQLTLMKRETKAFGKGPFVHNAPPFCPLSLEYNNFDKERIKMVGTFVFQQNVKKKKMKLQ